jgi:hypothetical protein
METANFKDVLDEFPRAVRRIDHPQPPPPPRTRVALPDSQPSVGNWPIRRCQMRSIGGRRVGGQRIVA